MSEDARIKEIKLRLYEKESGGERKRLRSDAREIIHDSRLMRKGCKMLRLRWKSSIRQAEAKGTKKRKRDEKEK
jgi:hypothetical protein